MTRYVHLILIIWNELHCLYSCIATVMCASRWCTGTKGIWAHGRVHLRNKPQSEVVRPTLVPWCTAASISQCIAYLCQCWFHHTVKFFKWERDAVQNHPTVGDAAQFENKFFDESFWLRTVRQQMFHHKMIQWQKLAILFGTVCRHRFGWLLKNLSSVKILRAQAHDLCLIIS